MDSIRIIQLPTKSAAGTDDYIAVDSTANGTKKIQFPNLLDDGLTIQNKAADAKATGDAISEVNGAIGNEASTRQSADANLQTQINQIIAPSGEAPSAAEVQNARIGAPPESTVYPTLGDAIRGQVTDLKSAFNYLAVGKPLNVSASTADDGRAYGTHVVDAILYPNTKITVTNNGSSTVLLYGVIPNSDQHPLLGSVASGATTDIAISNTLYQIRIYSDTYPMDVTIVSDSNIGSFVPNADYLNVLDAKRSASNSVVSASLDYAYSLMKSGLDTEIQFPTGGQSYRIPISLVAGVTYKFTSVGIWFSAAGYDKDGNRVNITEGTGSGRSVSFTPTNNIFRLNLYVSPAGSLKITAEKLTADTERSIASKADAFVGKFTADDVSHGIIERYGRRWRRDNYWFATDYIAIPILDKDTQITIASTIYADGGVAFYDSRKDCIFGISGENASDYGITPSAEIVLRQITAPKGTAYIRICFYTFNNDASLATNLLVSGDFNVNKLVEAIQPVSASASLNADYALCRWYDGAVYLTRNGVPQGDGLLIPDIANGRLYNRTLLFEDDFSGTELDTDVWEYEIGYKRNNEPQVYLANNVAVQNSNLVITAIREHVQAEKDGVLTDFDWTSGSIKCSMPYSHGRIEAKILFPTTVGAFGAFWGVGSVGTYPACGEIDVIENNPSSADPNNITCGAYGVDGDNNMTSFGRRYFSSYNQNGYHIYAVELTETAMEFFIDGNLVQSIDTSDASMSEFHNPYTWLLNLALSPASFGPAFQPPEDVDEYKMYVDWFRFYAPN